MTDREPGRRLAAWPALFATVLLFAVLLAPALHDHSSFRSPERCATCTLALHNPSAVDAPLVVVHVESFPTHLDARAPIAHASPSVRVHGSRSPPL